MSQSNLVKIRPIAVSNIIQEKTIGYAIKPELLLKLLGRFELACINAKKMNLRAYNSRSDANSLAIEKNFWTPDYCFIGSVVDKSEDISLRLLMGMLSGTSNKTKAANFSANFNKHFPKKDKDYTYYYRLKKINPPAMMYIKGVKFIASVLYQYELYKQTNSLVELGLLDEFMRVSGAGCLINPKLVELMADYQQFYCYNHIPERNDIIIQPNLSLTTGVELPVQNSHIQTIFIADTNTNKEANDKQEGAIKDTFKADITKESTNEDIVEESDFVDKFVTADSIDKESYSLATKEVVESSHIDDLEADNELAGMDGSDKEKQATDEQIEAPASVEDNDVYMQEGSLVDGEDTNAKADDNNDSEKDSVADKEDEYGRDRAIGIHALLEQSSASKINEKDPFVASPTLAPPRTGLLDKFKLGGLNLDGWDIETPEDDNSSEVITEDYVDVSSLFRSATKEHNGSDD